MSEDKLIEFSHRGYRFGSLCELPESLWGELFPYLEDLPEGAVPSLGGRFPVRRVTLPGLGAVVIKYYFRGGLSRFLSSRTYLRFGETRSEREFELLTKAREVGVHAPEPLIHVSKGRFAYHAWLVTREIENAQSLAELAARDEERARRLMSEVLAQVTTLISNRIFHVDLHPGNVLVDENDSVYLMDFDKARLYPGNRNKLRDLYLLRWRRAAIKHELPEFLCETVCLGLRRSCEQ